MGKTALCLVTISLSLFVNKSCIACSNGFNENIEGVLGRNVTLRCNTSWKCNEILWFRPASGHEVPISGEQQQVGHNSSYLRIPVIGFHDDGLYQCLCHILGASVNTICSVTLNTICQATVLLSRGTNIYSSSSRSTHVVDITAGETLGSECSEDTTPVASCEITRLPASTELIYYFEVLPEHNSCWIECRWTSEKRDSCSVVFSLNVTVLETFTQPTTSTRVSTVSSQASADENVLTATSTNNIASTPTPVLTLPDEPFVNQSAFTIIPNDRYGTPYTTMTDVQQTENDNSETSKSGSFPTMILVGVLIVILVGVLFLVCFFFFSKSKSTLRPKRTQTPGNEFPNTNIPIGPTYAIVDKSSPGCTKGDDDSEWGIPCADDAYAEVNSAVNGESSTQQNNADRAETPITKDYYSVVNTSNSQLQSTDSGNKCDSALYTEVNKGVKQDGKKVDTFSPGSSGCNPDVPDVQPYDVLEQPESSEYDAVGVVSTSPALYAVVEKERKKE